MEGSAPGVIRGHTPRFYQGRKRLFKRERTLRPCDADFLMQVLQRIFANMLSCTVTQHQQFRGGYAPSSNLWK